MKHLYLVIHAPKRAKRDAFHTFVKVIEAKSAKEAIETYTDIAVHDRRVARPNDGDYTKIKANLIANHDLYLF